VAQSRLAGRAPTLLPTAKYRPPDGTFSHRFTIARSQSPFGTAQARSLFEPIGDAAADEAERREDAVSPASFKPKRERRTIKWETLVTGLQTKDDIYSIVLVRPFPDSLHPAPSRPRQHGQRVAPAAD
jgi:hypothetical protein